jgi:uncharacterized membrane protein
MRAIRTTIDSQERRHGGELRFVVEASLPWRNLWRGQRARARAVELFGQLRIWDTEHNNGVLIYLLLADKSVEIIADRGIDRKAGDASWAIVCREMQRAFANGHFEEGVSAGIVAISDLLANHYPPAAIPPNALPNEPLIL